MQNSQNQLKDIQMSDYMTINGKLKMDYCKCKSFITPILFQADESDCGLRNKHRQFDNQDTHNDGLRASSNTLRSFHSRLGPHPFAFSCGSTDSSHNLCNWHHFNINPIFITRFHQNDKFIKLHSTHCS